MAYEQDNPADKPQQNAMENKYIRWHFDVTLNVCRSPELRIYDDKASFRLTRQIWGFDTCDRPSNLTQIGLKSSIVRPCDLEIWWMTPKNNRAHLLYNIKLYVSFHIHQWIQTGVTVRKRLIWVKLDIFLAVWPCNLTFDLEKQQSTSFMLLQALCIIPYPLVNSNLS